MLRLPRPATVFGKPYQGLQRLQRIKVWMRAHEQSNHFEYEAFDAVLTLWLMGLVGVLPAIVLQQWWALPLCWLAAQSPKLYLSWRLRLHAQDTLRCDWLNLI
jgi:hypothetical protein